MLVALVCAGVVAVGCSSPERIESASLPTPTGSAANPSAPTLTASATPPPTVRPAPTPSPTPTATPEPTATPQPTPTPTPRPPLLYIGELTLSDIDGSPLEFLSVDEHSFFDGFTPIHGTIAIVGEGEITDVVLEVVDVATEASFEVELTPGAREQLLGPFGETGRIEIAEGQLLFEIPSTAFAPFDTSEDGYVQLRLKVRTADGREAVRSSGYRWIRKLVLYTGDNRYFVGEEDQGGNSWVTPNVRALLERLDGIEIGDISNMNGGPFPPHVSHQRGVDVDIWFSGYNERDGAAARFMLDLLNQPGVIERVELGFVAYEQADEDLFWAEIRNVTLLDGRPASEVFLPEPDHTGHFHLRLYR